MTSSSVHGRTNVRIRVHYVFSITLYAEVCSLRHELVDSFTGRKTGLVRRVSRAS